jgi:GNAT superfamily N-acetyltransferase
VTVLLHFDAFDPQSEADLLAATELWNGACGPDLAITVEAVDYNTRPLPGVTRAGRIARLGDRAVGFVLALESTRGDPQVAPTDFGWIDAIAVAPTHAGRGIGSALLDWSEEWLSAARCTHFRLGGSVRPFAPSLPAGLPAEGFFRRRGYANRTHGPTVWDVASDLRSYRTPQAVRLASDADIRPAGAGDAAALSEFFSRAFPGRWAYEHEQFLACGGRISDFTVLHKNGHIEGFSWLTFEDSARPLDRVFMHRLPRPWGHLGPIGVSREVRGGGYGGALLDAGLRRMRDAGVAGCVIDWTDLLDFYGKFGFAPFRQYEMLVKAKQ